ncbi:MAG: aldo/keto reductase, partial [Coriobacteriales bacterium]|nr:aldo/keto reductase [Coriobacteriales bacterium]
VNYLDTAYVYEGSEATLAKALTGGYRERIHLASKSNTWGIEKHADFERYLDEQLKRLDTDYLDVYLLHNLYDANWERVVRYDGFGFLDDMVKKGKIRYKGFSLHNTLDAFKEIVDSFAWDMTQIQLNILDEHVQAGVEGLHYAAERELAVVVMEPLRGGSIVTDRPAEIDTLVAAHPEKRSLVDWCFRWLYDKPEVSLILSGTSSLEQLKDNLTIFEDSHSHVLSEDDRTFIATLQACYERQNSIGCTACGYCLPCPSGVAIPEIFRLYNNNVLTGNSFVDKLVYSGGYLTKGRGADQCVECGSCEEACPQSLPIIESLKVAHEHLLMDVAGFRRKNE